jgi:hypothetical protein
MRPAHDVVDPLPVFLSVTVNGALHSLSTAAKLASPPAEESYDSAWAPIAKKARPRLEIVLGQLRGFHNAPSGGRIARTLEAFESIERAFAAMESAAPDDVAAAAAELTREVNAVIEGLKISAVA